MVRTIRWLIWLYVILLLTEGALRKWVLPGLSNPLLIVRDPVAIGIYIIAIAAGVFPTNRFMGTLGVITFLTMVFGLMAEQVVPAVYLFGLRTNFLHLPLLFIIGRVMNYDNVVKLGRWIILISIPMTFLVVQQFQAAPDDVLNTGAGGTGIQIETSGGKVRASGTFSFIAGVVCFYALVAGFLLNSVVRPKTYPRWLQCVGLSALVTAIATSGSRSALGGVMAVAAMVVLIVVANPAMIGRVIWGLTLISTLIFLVLQIGVVAEGVDILSLRFEEAGGNQGIWPRLFGSFMIPLNAFGVPFFGSGLGLGTNAGSAMVTGQIQFLLAEGEWDRLLLESGPLAGGLFIAWRIALVFHLFRISLGAAKRNNLLPILLFGASSMFILNGQFGQPTVLGFAVLVGGLCLAAANQTEKNPPSVVLPVNNERARPKIRSRSPYAEALHTQKREAIEPQNR